MKPSVFYAYFVRIGERAMTREGRYRKTLKVRIDAELLDSVKEEAKRLNTDVSTYVRWCIRTGLYLGDLNSFVRSKSGESK